jgi:uncharacterized membrane protein HdeD (DUF308 family)
MLLGFLDLLAGIVLKLGESWMPGLLLGFTVLFLIFKGVTTMIRFPIWFGPISFFAGIIDFLAGTSLYFSHSYTGALVTVSAVLGVYLMLKGGFTVVFGLVTM